MKGIRRYIQANGKIPLAFAVGGLIWTGCFGFPLFNEWSPFTSDKACLLLISNGMIGLLFASFFTVRKWLAVPCLCLGCTAVGLLCRYLLEYGEVSNRENFTLLNIVIYLAVVPVLCTAVWGVIKRGSRE